MKKERAKDIIADFVNSPLKTCANREIVLPSNINKVISLIGPRRCGKTYMLYNLVA